MSSSRPLRIAAIGARGVPSNYSGIETIWENLFGEFVRMGHQVTIYCRPGVINEPYGVYNGLRQVRMPAPGGKNFETLSHSYLSMRHAVKNGDVHDGGARFDLISVHAVAPNLALGIAHRKKFPIVSHVHGLDHRREKWKGIGQKIIMRGERKMVRLADEVVVVNDELVDYYFSEYGLKTHLLPNGIHPISDTFTPHSDTLRQFNLEAGRFIVSIGRLVPEKRQFDTIAAFKQIKTDFKLVFVGEGKHTPEYVQQLKDQAADDPRIVFTGLQKGEALDTLFRCAGLYVTASELEGWPSSLLECVDRNVPAIVSEIGPHTQLMRQVKGYDLSFKTGMVDSLKDRIEYALANADHARELASRGRAMVRAKYTWPVLARATEKLYREVVDRRSNID